MGTATAPVIRSGNVISPALSRFRTASRFQRRGLCGICDSRDQAYLLRAQIVQLSLHRPLGRFPELLVDVDVYVFDDLAAGGVATEVP